MLKVKNLKEAKQYSKQLNKQMMKQPVISDVDINDTICSLKQQIHELEMKMENAFKRIIELECFLPRADTQVDKRDKL